MRSEEILGGLGYSDTDRNSPADETHERDWNQYHQPRNLLLALVGEVGEVSELFRQLQAQFTDERDWNQYHQPRNLLLALVGEVGEVSELFQWKGEVAEGLPDWSEQERMALSHELSDVLIYLVELAEKCHVDLPRAVLEKMELNRIKYPASKVHGSAKKYTEYQD
ncbi:UNVERIFIED_CONTAM: hypothetical protein FKN15_077609 [Acipenser sinensis]